MKNMQVEYKITNGFPIRIACLLILYTFFLLGGCASKKSESFTNHIIRTSSALGPGELPFAENKMVYGGHLIIGNQYSETIKMIPTIRGSLPEIPVKAISTCGCIHPIIQPSSKSDTLGGFTVRFIYAPKGPEGHDIQIIRLLTKNEQVVGKIDVEANVVGMFSIHPNQAAFGKLKTGSGKFIRIKVTANTKFPIPKHFTSSLKEISIQSISQSDHVSIYDLKLNGNVIPGPANGTIEWKSGKPNANDPVLPVTGYIDGGWRSEPESLLFPPHSSQSKMTTSFRLYPISPKISVHSPINAISDNPEIHIQLKQANGFSVWYGKVTLQPIPGRGEVKRGEIIIRDKKGEALLRVPYLGIIMSR
jgi:hypothetical protein